MVAESISVPIDGFRLVVPDIKYEYNAVIYRIGKYAIAKDRYGNRIAISGNHTSVLNSTISYCNTNFGSVAILVMDDLDLNPITVSGVKTLILVGDDVTFKFSGSGDALHIDGADKVIIRGIRFDLNGEQSAGLVIVNANIAIVDSCEFDGTVSNIWQLCIWDKQYNDTGVHANDIAVVMNCKFENYTKNKDAVALSWNKLAIVYNCVFNNLSGDGGAGLSLYRNDMAVASKCVMSSVVKVMSIATSSKDSQVAVISECTINDSAPIVAYNSNNVYIYKNRLYKSSIHVEADDGDPHYNVHVERNYVSDNGTYGILVIPKNGSTLYDIYVEKNTVVHNGWQGIVVIANRAVVKGNVSKNNCWNAGGYKYGIKLTIMESAIVSDNIVYDDQSTVTQPYSIGIGVPSGYYPYMIVRNNILLKPVQWLVGGTVYGEPQEEHKNVIIGMNYGLPPPITYKSALSVAVGTGGTFGAASSVRPIRGYFNDFDIEIVVGGTLATGESITVKIEIAWDNGNTTYVEKSYSATGTYSISESDKIQLLSQNSLPRQMNIYATSSKTTTSATVSVNVVLK